MAGLPPMLRPILPLSALLGLAASAHADPRLSSWFTSPSGRYARIYETDAARNANNAVATWSRGQGVQSSPTYAGISEISFSASWVYIRTTGMGYHVMGPWYLNAARTQLFGNYPANTSALYRFPRSPTVPASKTLTGLGAIGYFVDGVAMFDNRDAFSYSNSAGTDATPVNGVTGDGIWNRDAYVNEGITFDSALAHQAGRVYHYHANPPALRYQLGDHVDYDPATRSFKENSAPPRHSPILGWVRDGFPVYGPYGHSSALDPNSPARRMISGYVKRDGSQGTTDLRSTGRTTLPPWASRAQNRPESLAANQFGPNVSATYILGHYLEDYDYLGDRGLTQGTHFDLDASNGRFCVTPEFPQGTYAYFVSIEADGSPKFPYNIGRWFHGSPTGAAVTAINETVQRHFHGAPDRPETWTQNPISRSPTTVTLTWNAAEGGSYRVEASSDLQQWSALTPTVTAPTNVASLTDPTTNSGRFYRITRTALAPWDSSGFNTAHGTAAPSGPVSPSSGNRGSALPLTVTIPTDASPPVPPANVAIYSFTVGSINVTGAAHPSQYVVSGNLNIPANAATGSQTVTVVFTGPGGGPGPTYSFPASFTIQ
jgi:hypothetical protein